MMSFTVTAVIPTHKRPFLLGRAIDSVLSQSVQVDEILIIDDACCEITEELVNKYAVRRLKYFRSPFSGASASRNHGVSLASSDYVAFLDDDDEWTVDKIKLQKELVSKENLDVCFSKIKIVYEGVGVSYCTRTRLPDNLLEEICVENCIGGTISAMIRRDLLLELGGFDVSFPAREEYDLWIRLVHSGAVVGMVGLPLSVAYRSINDRPRISSSLQSYQAAISILNSKHEILIDKYLSLTKQKSRRAKQMQFLACHAVTSGNRREALRFFLNSLCVKFNLKVLLMAILAFIDPVILIRLRSLTDKMSRNVSI